MDELYTEIMVWRRIDTASAIRYSCLNDLSTGQFAVQSADFHYLSDVSKIDFEKQFVELLIEVSPRERCSWFNTLNQAIEDHEQVFGGKKE